MSTEVKEDKECFCRHLVALKDIKETIRKISHDLSQPIMVVQGYLELINLGKYGSDADSMNQTLLYIADQMESLNIIIRRLKDAVCPDEVRRKMTKRPVP